MSFSASHRIYVKSLYKRYLKQGLDWYIRRDLWRDYAIEIRAKFEANRNITNPRQLAKVLEHFEERLANRKHPDPYIPVLMPGGSKVTLKKLFPYKPPELAIDHLIIGGGVVGLAVAQKLAERFPTRSTYLIERHERAGEETSSRNSEVIHAELAQDTAVCARTQAALRPLQKPQNRSQENGEVIGTSQSQSQYLRNLHAHTQSEKVNVPTQLISGEEALKYEPDLSRTITSALYSPETGIIDSHGLMDSFEKDIGETESCELVYGTNVVRIDPHNIDSASRKGEGDDRGYVVQMLTEGSDRTDALLARSVINCAGLNAHTMLNMVLPQAEQRTLWYAKGSWFQYKGPGVSNVSHLLYPCPEPSLAGLGTHLTLGLDGTSVKFGPDVEHLPESTEIDYWKEHLKPSEKNMGKVIDAVQKYLPGVDPNGFSPDQAGLRVKRYPPSSNQFSDFEIIHDAENSPGMISCFGIESPGLTGCMAIAEEVERRISEEVWGAGKGKRVSEAGNPSSMSGQSLYRHLRNWYRVGLRDAWTQLNESVDVKAGRLAGTDKFGNKYFENLEKEMPEAAWRQRWVRYAQSSPLENASQVPSEWHAWLHHTRLNAPHEDEVVKKITAQTEHWRPAENHIENLTVSLSTYAMISAESSIYSDLNLNQEDLENIDAANAITIDNAQPQLNELLQDAETWQFSDYDDEDDNISTIPRVPTRRSKPGFERLRVLDVTEARSDNNRLQKLLKCRRAKSSDLVLVILCDDWVESHVAIDDKVHVIGDFDINVSSNKEPLSVDRTVYVTAKENLLILHPDILISVTKVADTAFCSRKALISERIRTVGEQKSKALVYGNIIHEVVQRCLSDGGNFAEKNVRNNLYSVLKIYLADLWESDLDYNASFEECNEKLQKLYNFGQTYFGDIPKDEAEIYDARAGRKDTPTLAISSLCAMEEDIWSPKYGLKGKVDATIRGSLNLKSQGMVNDIVMPLEIKTGKSTIGIEHRAQTMLYSMMIAERYESVIPSGLLWYTTDNSIKRITPMRVELRGLMIKRNILAHHMSIKEPSKFLKKFKGENVSDLPDIEDSILPPTIDNKHACPRCFVADACMLYKKALEGPPNPTECDIHELVEKKAGSLTVQQTEFFRAWEELISIEEADSIKFRKHLWTLNSDERERKGMCFGGMKITDTSTNSLQAQDAPVTSYRTAYIYEFSKVQFAKLPHSQIVVNDAVVISIEPDIVAIGKGFVLSLTGESITVGLNTPLNSSVFERRSDLNTPSTGCYRLDKDELGTGIAAVRDSLASMFYPTTNPRRRELIVDLKKPTYSDEHIPSDQHSKAYDGLNDDQRSAVQRVINTNEYALILGMPGTGKTTTVATTIKELVKRGKSVLLASYTHSAVDTILRKLDTSEIEVLRLGQRSKIHEDVLKFVRTVDERTQSIEELDRLFLNPQVVATTCLGINHPLFTKRHFDYCIVDEASQITLPVCLGPIRFSDKFILVGDHYQLPPLVRSEFAKKNGLDISLFRRLCEHHPESVVHLAHQYRMAEDIMYLSNELVYDKKLVCGNGSVAMQKLNLTSAFKMKEDSHWFTRIINPENRVVFVNTDEIPARETVDGDLVQNIGEAAIVTKIAEGLLRLGVSENQIGIISFYRKQIYHLQSRLQKHKTVELLTADRSQGRDKDCIIVSLCRSNTKNQIGDLLNDWRRINVSLTRARCKLIVVGSASTIALSKKLDEFVKLVKKKGWMVNVPSDAGVCDTPSSSPKKPALSVSNSSHHSSHHSSQSNVMQSRSDTPDKPLKRRQTINQSPYKENKKIKKEEDSGATLSINQDLLPYTHLQMNPNARSFNFNPSASGFVPSWAAPPQAQQQQQQQADQQFAQGYPYGGGYPYDQQYYPQQGYGGYPAAVPQFAPPQQEPQQPQQPARLSAKEQMEMMSGSGATKSPPVSLSLGGGGPAKPSAKELLERKSETPAKSMSISMGGSKPKPAAAPATSEKKEAAAPAPAAAPEKPAPAPSVTEKKDHSPAPTPSPAAASSRASAKSTDNSDSNAVSGANTPMSKSALQAAQSKTDTIVKESKAAADADTLKDLFGADGVQPKQHLNVVFCGHVDAGKSTMGGQLLHLTGMVDKRTLEKYERDAKEAGRESWYLSWALDSTPQEREKGKTVEVGRAFFETEKRRYTILDAPGHKGYVPSMISGAAQADVAVLVISARKGEFETGFEKGGQTREHVVLAKTAGVQKIIVVINKMDEPTVQWDKARYDDIVSKLNPFLKGSGFSLKTDVTYIPVSAYSGDNIKDKVSKPEAEWCDSPALIPFLDSMPLVDRNYSAPLMMPISEKYKDMGTMVVGKIESGTLKCGDKLTLMPNKDQVEVMTIEDELDEPIQIALCGDNVTLKLRGVDDENVQVGFVLTDPRKPVKTVKQFEAQLAILDHKNIICAGYSAMMHCHTLAEEVHLSELLHYYDKKTGRKSKKAPQFAKKGQKVVALLESTGSVCVESFNDYPQLGRFTLRDEGKTVAIGKITKLIEKTESGELADVSTGVQQLSVNK
ncbi:hypothetical protein E3P94_01970 [Wallemia ichthyophaga]|nr:hypothetical protein E3P95_01584 [Wallemia ichthyophaga]TIB01011.1 hypothetical protein E3P94_01970 [Wallemia ichthyophaga]